MADRLDQNYALLSGSTIPKTKTLHWLISKIWTLSRYFYREPAQSEAMGAFQGSRTASP
jgi:hypothetical protein